MADSSSRAIRDGRWSVALLVAGASTGLLAAAFALLNPFSPSAQTLPRGAAARVNGTIITEDAYQRALAALASDAKDSVSASQREYVLSRLIDEELLVQRGLALGLAESDRMVRAAIVRSAIAAVTAQAEARPPSDAELRRFYAENSALFASTERLRVAALWFKDRAPAESVGKLGGSGKPIAVSSGTALPMSGMLPDAFMPLGKLREYIGPTASERAASLSVGEISQPIAQGDGYIVVQLLGRESAEAPPFESIRTEVQSAWSKQAGNAALREYLDTLKSRASIQLGAIR